MCLLNPIQLGLVYSKYTNGEIKHNAANRLPQNKIANKFVESQ